MATQYLFILPCIFSHKIPPPEATAHHPQATFWPPASVLLSISLASHQTDTRTRKQNLLITTGFPISSVIMAPKGQPADELTLSDREVQLAIIALQCLEVDAKVSQPLHPHLTSFPSRIPLPVSDIHHTCIRARSYYLLHTAHEPVSRSS